MAYFGGFCDTNLIILFYNQVESILNLKPVFSSGKLPQSEDNALAKLPEKVVLSPYCCPLGLGLTPRLPFGCQDDVT